MDFIDIELHRFEEELTQQLMRIKPDGKFVEDLRSNLVNSRVFECRRAIGAIVVASLSVIFAGTASYAIIRLARQARRS